MASLCTADVELFRNVPLRVPLLGRYFAVRALAADAMGHWMKRGMPKGRSARVRKSARHGQGCAGDIG